MRKKDQTDDEAAATGDASASRLTPADVQNKEFGLSFRGYNERDVDEFLDRVTEDLAWYIDENRKLRSQLASSGYVDPVEWGANADAAAAGVLAKAKEEADRIVHEAEARAAAIGTAGATDARAIVAPYLNREREFLQSLGGLVQQHAETIKAMVQEARRRTEAEPAPEAAPEAAPASAEPEPAPIVIRDEGVGAAPPMEASAGAERAAVASSPGESVGEDEEHRRSLRELFWGED